MKKTTLAEAGNTMPIGIEAPTTHINPKLELRKSFAFKPFRLKEEKELAELKAKSTYTNGRYISAVLATMTTEVGGQKFAPEMSLEQKLLLFNQMYAVDVLYMYLCLRYEAMGPSLGMRAACPKCRESFGFHADLNTLEVHAVEPTDAADALRREVTLPGGLMYQGSKRKKLTVRPFRWAALENTSSLNNVVEVRAHCVLDSICGVDGVPPERFSPLPPEALDELPKREWELLAKSVEQEGEVAPGPVMAAEGECPKCKTKVVQRIDWGYDSFFGPSSL